MNPHMKEVIPPRSKKVFPKMLQEASHRNQANLLSPAPVKTYRPPVSNLWPAPPQPHPKGRMSSHASEERRGGLQQAEQLLFRSVFFCFPILSWSIWRIYFLPLSPLRLCRASITSYTQSLQPGIWHRTRLPQSQHSDTWGMK